MSIDIRKEAHMNTPDKSTINKVIDGIASHEEAKLVTEWFSTTVEGQAYLSALISRDFHSMEAGELDANLPIAAISEEMLENIFKDIRRKKWRKKQVSHWVPSKRAFDMPSGSCGNCTASILRQWFYLPF